MKAFDREKIIAAIRDDIIHAHNKRTESPDLYSNTLDCFSAVIDASILSISLDEWISLEENRQTQKTIQNLVGDFHQKVIGSVDGWESLPTGGVIDIVSESNQIIAEIKNKWNTTKGNHKKNIYDDLQNQLETRYSGYTSYYVGILPKSTKKKIDCEFTPPDNTRRGERREANPKIREIDGRSFYEIVTGYDDAIDQLYFELPSIIQEILIQHVPGYKKADFDLEMQKKFFDKAFLDF